MKFYYLRCFNVCGEIIWVWDHKLSGGELLELRLLDTHLLDTFGRKSTARHKNDKLLESS
jgi:hypothetical protein